MTHLCAALHVEARKALASRALRTTTVLVIAGISVLGGTLVAAAIGGNEQVTSQLGPLADETGWPLFTGVVAQVTAAGGLLAFGVALTWNFGREFADGTITGLFALPTPRATIAVAKLIIHGAWVIGVALIFTALLAVTGLILRLGAIDAVVLGHLGRQLVLTVLTGLIATPAAWAATLGRGFLPGIATTVGLIVVAQVTVIVDPDTAAWFPLAAPALWALFPGSVSAPQLLAVAIVPVTFGALTARAWQRLRLDR